MAEKRSLDHCISDKPSKKTKYADTKSASTSEPISFGLNISSIKIQKKQRLEGLFGTPAAPEKQIKPPTEANGSISALKRTPESQTQLAVSIPTPEKKKKSKEELRRANGPISSDSVNRNDEHQPSAEEITNAINASKLLRQFLESQGRDTSDLIQIEQELQKREKVMQKARKAEAKAGHRTTTKLPPLPEILDSSLKEAALLHTSEAAATGQNNYERLEFLGDAIIEDVSSRIIYQRFPERPAGKMASLRESMVKNEILAGFALQYGFDERVACGDQERHSKVFNKILADVFEAHVAAVFLSYADPNEGFKKVREWMAHLWEETLRDAEFEQTLPAGADFKQELARMIINATAGCRLEYKDLTRSKLNKANGTYDFHIGVLFTGWEYNKVLLGEGHGLNKKEAGARAAENAFKVKKDLLQKLHNKKRDWEAKRKEK